MLPTLWTRGALNSPFESLMDMRREMNRALDGWTTPMFEGTAWSLPTDVRETPDALEIAIEIPGLTREDIELTLENNVLTVSGEKKFEHDEEREKNYRLYERRYGRFERSFRIPSNVRADAVQADYANGVLTIALPKAEEARPRRIPVGAARELKK